MTSVHILYMYLSLCFIPQSVFYTYEPRSVFYTQSIVRSLQSVLKFYADRFHINKPAQSELVNYIQLPIAIKHQFVLKNCSERSSTNGENLVQMYLISK